MYYALRETRYKWLDVDQLCRRMLPRDTIHRIRYFTALVEPRPGDSGQRQRQDIFLRALRTIPHLTIHSGTFLSSTPMMMLQTPLADGTRFVRVLKTEEKGSDVNIASYLLRDGFLGEYDAAAVISNDSDLCEPIRMVRDELQLPIAVLCPHDAPSRALLMSASYWREIRTATLRDCQFPPVLTDAQGEFHKPPRWDLGAMEREPRRPTKKQRKA